MSKEVEGIQKEDNSLGIPKAIFLEDVEKFMKEDNKSAEVVIRKLEELFQKYRVMEVSLLQKKEKLKTQIPDIKQSLDMVKLLGRNNDEKRTVETDFILAHNLYARAEIPPTKNVSLWLGANVMLEYSLEQADELLTKNHNQAKLTMEQTDKDLDFLKDQITTTEVNIARVYNWDVKRRQILKQSGAPVSAQ
jgi:prefoldin subunit 5